MKHLHQLILLCLLMVGNSYAETLKGSFTFTVSIENRQYDEGAIRVLLFDKENGFPDDVQLAISEHQLSLNKLENSVDITTQSKEIAIFVYQDTDNNGKLTTNWLGMPTEPIGFSNNAKGSFGPPNFADCVLNLESTKQTTIKLITL